MSDRTSPSGFDLQVVEIYSNDPRKIKSIDGTWLWIKCWYRTSEYHDVPSDDYQRRGSLSIFARVITNFISGSRYRSSYPTPNPPLSTLRDKTVSECIHPHFRSHIDPYSAPPHPIDPIVYIYVILFSLIGLPATLLLNLSSSHPYHGLLFR